MTENETNIVLEAIKTRRSIRKYKSDPVPQALIDKVIEAGTYAASGKSQQPWLVIEVTDTATKDRIRRANAIIMGKDESADPFYGAPVYLIVLAERSNPNHVYDGTLMLGNMMLAAHAVGLASCWINRAREEFDQPEWQDWLKSLGVEGDYEGIGHLALGYADGEARPPKERKQCVIKV
ncbi:MAG: nitroreductase [Prevotella sp.]|nr:nitroreductase [Prevotella sp.]MDY5667239.1 nitroreductase [Alloprevotella sp.]